LVAAFIGLAVAVAACALALVLTDSLSPHGVLYGTFDRCAPVMRLKAEGTFSAALPTCPEYGWQDGPRVVVPDPARKIPFVRTSDGRTYVAVTDSIGRYSISLPAGHYTIKGFFANISPAQVIVTAGQRVEVDFQYDWPN
jgi:hypothetical protein